MSFSFTSPSALTASPRGALLTLTGFEPKHPSHEPLRDFLSLASTSHTSTPFLHTELTQPLKLLVDHWVETVGDLRLLSQEGLLTSLDLPPRLTSWIEDELSQIQPSSAFPKSSFPFPPPSTSSLPLPSPLTFRYQSDLDTNGLFYYLGTLQNTVPYANPASRGLVRVTCSALMKDSLPIDHVVGRSLVRCVTAAEPAAWICIELIGYWLRPSAYTLRHYLSWDTECMRNWRLEGSRDGKLFSPLSVHVNDAGINGIGSTHTWPISLAPSPHPLHHYYRFFRLTLTGPNNNNHLYLACSGSEFYGDVLTSELYNAALAASSSAFSSSPFSSSAPLPISNGVHSAPVDDVEMKGALSPPPFSGGSHFVYHHDLDHNGLIYAIATNYHTTPWTNPVDSHLISITSSSLLEDSAPLSSIAGPDVVRCVTQPRPNSWICIDLIDKTFILTAYTLRHYASWDIEALRNWRLEGSMEGVEWALLREHVQDESLDKKGKTATWTIDMTREEARRPWRMFRILQTGENSNKHHYLACSGWEMYGQLFAADGVSPYIFPSPPSSLPSSLSASAPVFHPSSSVTLSYVSDFDHNGVLHYIATCSLTRPWINPHTAGLVCVTASSLADDSVGVEAIVGKDVVRCVTQNAPSSWIQLDLQDNRLCPTAYTLRHYSSWDTESLRSWKLEGSNGEGERWELISEHWNDESLTLKGSTHTWRVQCNSFYSVFRITQTAENSNKHHYLACSGWEMYGQLRHRGRDNGNQPMELSNEIAPVKASVAVESSSSSTSSSASTSPFVVSFPPIPAVEPFPSPQSLHSPSFASSHNLTVSTASPAPPPPRSLQPTRSPSSRTSFTAVPSSLSSPSSVPLPSVSSPCYNYIWESVEHGPFLVISPSSPSIVRNSGSSDKWQMVRSSQSFSSGVQRIAIRILSDPYTSNTWRFILGVIPSTLDCSGPKQWVGTGGSWGYIAGTGGKCHHAAKSETYGETYAEGDTIGIEMNFDTKTIKFWKNGISQGVAYDDLQGPVHIGASLTAMESALALIPFSEEVDNSQTAQAAQQAMLSAAAAVTGRGGIASPTAPPQLHHTVSVQSAPPASSPSSHPPPVLRSNTLPSPIISPHLSSSWDPAHKSQFLIIDPSDPSIVRNSGSNDKWQCIRSLHAFSRTPHVAHHSFSITVLESPKTPNSWISIVGLVPASFTCSGSKQWVGAGGSWGYIAGTGGKCSAEPKSKQYGEVWGVKNDVIMVKLDLNLGTVEFVKNGVSQGIAFDGVQGPVYAAVSLTAAGAAIKLTIHD